MEVEQDKKEKEKAKEQKNNKKDVKMEERKEEKRENILWEMEVEQDKKIFFNFSVHFLNILYW